MAKIIDFDTGKEVVPLARENYAADRRLETCHNQLIFLRGDIEYLQGFIGVFSEKQSMRLANIQNQLRLVQSAVLTTINERKKT